MLPAWTVAIPNRQQRFLGRTHKTCTQPQRNDAFGGTHLAHAKGHTFSINPLWGGLFPWLFSLSLETKQSGEFHDVARRMAGCCNRPKPKKKGESHDT